MIQKYIRPVRVSICQRCHGRGTIDLSERPADDGGTTHVLIRGICPQCEGSGRVTVSQEVTMDIRPYKPKN